MITALTTLIEEWAKERNLHTADPDKQMLKLGEEFGELCQGMAKNKPDQIEDSIGDMYVVMTILSMQLRLDIEDCVFKAYQEIKDRKGKMINGVFVKESDLKEAEG
nr:MazG-like family protein [uncultured Trichococcus sp.]